MKLLQVPYGTKTEDDFIDELETQAQELRVKITDDLMNVPGYNKALMIDKYLALVALARKKNQGFETWKQDHYCSFLDEAESFLKRYQIEN